MKSSVELPASETWNLFHGLFHAIKTLKRLRIFERVYTGPKPGVNESSTRVANSAFRTSPSALA